MIQTNLDLRYKQDITKHHYHISGYFIDNKGGAKNYNLVRGILEILVYVRHRIKNKNCYKNKTFGFIETLSSIHPFTLYTHLSLQGCGRTSDSSLQQSQFGSSQHIFKRMTFAEVFKEV